MFKYTFQILIILALLILPLKSQEFEITLSNMIGKEIFSDKFDDFFGKYINKIDLSTKSKGIYFLEIETNEGLINKKLIMQ